jgi:hypothetical protein
MIDEFHISSLVRRQVGFLEVANVCSDDFLSVLQYFSRSACARFGGLRLIHGSTATCPGKAGIGRQRSLRASGGRP